MSAEAPTTTAKEEVTSPQLPTETPQSSNDTVSHHAPPTSNSTFNIFVGDLPVSITEAQLLEHFNTYGEIKNVNVIRDRVTGACKGYAFVHFAQKESREKALLPENVSPMLGGQIARVKPSDEKTTLVINNASPQLSDAALKTELLALLTGIATSLRIESRTGTQANIIFDSFDIANLAKKALMNAPLAGRQLTVTWQTAGVEARPTASPNPSGPGRNDDPASVTTLHISNIAAAATEDDLRELFVRFGEVTRPVIVKNALGEKRGFGFVTFPDREACVTAMRDLDQTDFFGQRIGVALAKATSGSASSTTRAPGGAPSTRGRGGPDRTGRFDRGGPANRHDRSSPYGGASGGVGMPQAGAYPPPGAYPYAMPYPAMNGAPWGFYDPNMYAAAAAGGAAGAVPAGAYYGYPYADPSMYAAAAAAAAAGGYGMPGAPAPGAPAPGPAPPRYY